VAELATHEDLLVVLRAVPGLAERGRTPGHFYLRGRPFLHFHGAGSERTADLRRTGDWERFPAATPDDRVALVAKVAAFLGAKRPSR
jgi:hypothetical protein